MARSRPPSRITVGSHGSFLLYDERISILVQIREQWVSEGGQLNPMSRTTKPYASLQELAHRLNDTGCLVTRVRVHNKLLQELEKWLVCLEKEPLAEYPATIEVGE